MLLIVLNRLVNSTVLADAALVTSNTTQPNNPPKSLPDLVTETVDEADCPCDGNV